MRTQKQTTAPAVSKKRTKAYTRIWAASELRTYSKKDIIKRFYRFRTFYVMAWEDALSTGNLAEAEHFYTMSDRITRLLVDLASEETNLEVAVAQKVMKIPLMLAPMESLDFTHMLDSNGGRDGSN